ncbi:hypothetical protein OSG_eHP30_00170 [environmental Halophage eHP-30]|nr:hypothetical protein OSG_eHP30_00170 [environmental Halophage eHP-30]
MYLIGSKENIQAYIAKVDKFEGFTGNLTKSWAEPRKHPDKELYACPKNNSVEPHSQLTEKEELSSDWYPDDPLA